jgi:hypothetical protein
MKCQNAVKGQGEIISLLLFHSVYEVIIFPSVVRVKICGPKRTAAAIGEVNRQ